MSSMFIADSSPTGNVVGTHVKVRCSSRNTEENLALDSGNYAMRVVYILGSISAGVSKTVKFNIGRT
jgi:hypothetical protein